jgi:NADPH-dependent ferric siderophore reductase
MPKKPKPIPCILIVKDAFFLSPHMVRVVLTSPELESRPTGCEGANCKIFIPKRNKVQMN